MGGRGKLLARIAAAAVLAAAACERALAGGRAYGEVSDAADLDRVFGAIRAQAGRAQSRAELTRLYRQAGYLVTLTYSRPWRTKFGAGLSRLRDDAKRQFRATAQEINRRAAAIGTPPDYQESRSDG